MLSRLSRAVKARSTTLALVPALVTTVLFLAPVAPASAVTPLTGETLTGSGPSTGGTAFMVCGAYGCCPSAGSTSGSAGFNISGVAAGPYPGHFVESGSFSFSGYRNPPWTIRFHATFTITSGATTITGTLSNHYPASFMVAQICAAGRAVAWGPSLVINYSAALNGQTYQGTGTATGTLYIAAGVQDSIGESLTG